MLCHVIVFQRACYNYISKQGLAVEGVLETWLDWILCDLPFQHLVGPVCFLNMTCVVTEWLEDRPRVQELGCSVSGRVKAMTHKIDTCQLLAWHLVLIG